ncbi:nuclear transport factor 2 family protein [Dactylosporangium aurantiacum]|uniref:Nuclear transport factor 2 family protein n=1 Tax=Dactylosporangium aurantiacum TaxID=35754 RepID=A0A9Q9INF1_9ACTN|nr:nuclear transport factor 2 family protein [Dactylosporangium aurantiacum]MDG6107698.1 nuclear transport factor 2 family protein [Dactylosporangium aurantiacum]UWZ58711.1 nuclear transport factor 2 family protein [Dactylosporangium aurantiacum]
MSDERKVQEILARHVRATDRRDGKTQGALFTDDAVVQSFCKTGADAYEPVAPPLIGGAAVGYAVDNYMTAHPQGGSSHHVTADHIIEVDGEHAHMNAQFVVLRIQATARPAGGWPGGAFGAQGSVQPIESGYYDTDLRRIDGEGRIVGHRILLDMPYVIPGV